MIELIPAIDIIGGECVRLTKGDYAQKKVYNTDPVSVAMEFEAKGFKRLHVVDLDGAKSKHVVNDKVLHHITQDDMDKALDNGAAMVTIGSISYTNPQLFGSWIERYGAERIILGADVRDRKIAINGWLDCTECDIMEFLAHYIENGITNVLCTDISKDGALKGPSISLYKDIMQRFPQLHLIASGGVSSTEDILTLDREGIPAVVFGKAYYEGLIDIERLHKELKF